MRKLLVLLSLSSLAAFGQADTEVYLFDIQKTANGFELTNKKNISSNKGYDSQPYFYDANTLLFSSTRNGQTDILKYNINTGDKVFLNYTPKGGEYSPQRIPGSDEVSAVRLDNDGLQRFYKYNAEGNSTELIKDLKVAYPFWHDKKTVVASVIGKNNLELVISNIKKQQNYTLEKKVGRSFHRIPNSKDISYISKSDSIWQVRSLNVSRKKTAKITDLNGNFEDICWMPDGSILQAKKNVIVRFDPTTKSWSTFFSFENTELSNISRILVSKDGKRMAIVAESSAVFPVEKQLEFYNKRDIEAFVSYFSKDVKVYNYPQSLQYEGREEMKKRYAPFFSNTPDLHCKIVKRIVRGNIVIDEESVTANGRKFGAVAIYEIRNGEIISVTFL